MKQIGRESDLEKLNLTALRIARKVADETGTLMAGNICNTWAYDKDDPTTHAYVTSMFKVRYLFCFWSNQPNNYGIWMKDAMNMHPSYFIR